MESLSASHEFPPVTPSLRCSSTDVFIKTVSHHSSARNDSTFASDAQLSLSPSAPSLSYCGVTSNDMLEKRIDINRMQYGFGLPLIINTSDQHPSTENSSNRSSQSSIGALSDSCRESTDESNNMNRRNCPTTENQLVGITEQTSLNNNASKVLEPQQQRFRQLPNNQSDRELLDRAISEATTTTPLIGTTSKTVTLDPVQQGVCPHCLSVRARIENSRSFLSHLVSSCRELELAIRQRFHSDSLICYPNYVTEAEAVSTVTKYWKCIALPFQIFA